MEPFYSRGAGRGKACAGLYRTVSLALACAMAAGQLDGEVTRIEAWVSPNLMKTGLA